MFKEVVRKFVSIDDISDEDLQAIADKSFSLFRSPG